MGSSRTKARTRVPCIGRRILFFFFFFINLFIYLFIYFWLRWVFVAARGLSLVVVSGRPLFVAVHGLLIPVASLVAEEGL